MGTETFPVTVIAKKPSKEYGPFSDADERLFAATMKKLQAGKGPKPELAASVKDLEAILTNAKQKAGSKKLLSVQVIGHGFSGVLRLGASFMPSVVTSGSDPFFCIDTNPDSCNYMSKHRGEINDISLLGCNVGAPTYQTWPMTGRSLLYCYCDVLQCTVRAPVEVISDEDFDDSGRFTGKAVSIDYTAKGPTFGQKQLGTSSSTPAKAANAKSTVLEIDRFVGTILPGMPKPGPFKFEAQVIPVTWSKLAFATREITLRIKNGSEIYVVDRGRYLVDAGGNGYEVVKPDALVSAMYLRVWR
jgi:hypothetical protein